MLPYWGVLYAAAGQFLDAGDDFAELGGEAECFGEAGDGFVAQASADVGHGIDIRPGFAYSVHRLGGLAR
ncbi:hypothetical protein [Streptomyces gobiensis]|uniref:hypothetical protein n=1 Tax=Streptomyces gobiensis TaxID=2875706 RepID=UPI001E562CD6|nr:hypothetical protein [Streptomyces gobiensis]UGY92797.1 hypothetical protein test1122_14460 [Streptomyces gobiensis]